MCRTIHYNSIKERRCISLCHLLLESHTEGFLTYKRILQCLQTFLRANPSGMLKNNLATTVLLLIAKLTFCVFFLEVVYFDLFEVTWWAFCRVNLSISPCIFYFFSPLPWLSILICILYKHSTNADIQIEVWMNTQETIFETFCLTLPKHTL